MSSMTYAGAIQGALSTALAQDPSVIVYGLGVPDPKGVFGTTLDLQRDHGAVRVFDMPTSENAMTGIGIGAALGGLRPVLTHQRLDFALLSLDQIINNAAKWRFMFGGQRGVPITIRMILGRGWGQGPTHSQNLQALFAQIPGLCVVSPTTPADAKGLLLTSIFGEDPVIFLEHRWLHNLKGEVPEGDYRVPLGRAHMMRSGADVTVVAMSLMSLEAAHAVDHLSKQGVSCDLIDLRSLRPIDWPMIEASVRRTGRLLALDGGHETGGIAGEIIAHVATHCWKDLRGAPKRLAMPDVPEATSPALTEHYHVRAEHVAAAIAEMVGSDLETQSLTSARTFPHDVPGNWFQGPF